MPGAVATLVVRITSDLAQFNAGMSKASTRMAASSKKWATMGKSMTKGLTLPILAIGGVAVAAAMDVGKGMRIIQQRTGETGKAAERLGTSFKTVLKGVPESAEQVAEAMSQLHIKTGLVGKPLENLTTQLLNLARITKSDVVETTTNAGKVFNNWAIATKDQGKALDYLYGVTTKTGIPINSLMGDLTKFGPQLRGVGFSFESSAALIGTFDKAGLQTSKVMMGLNAGLSKLAKAGKDPAVEFPKLITQIKNAGSASEATRLSVELFGTRGGPAMSDAIRSGKVNFEELIKTLKKTHPSINDTAKKTMTLGGMFAVLQHKVSVALQPLGKGIMDAIKSILPIFSKLATVVGWVASVFSKIPGPIRTVIVVFALMVAAVGPVMMIGSKFMLLGSTIAKASGMISGKMGSLVSGIKGLGPRLASMGSAAVGAMKSMASGISSALSFLAANPIILIIAAIVAVIVIAAILIKKYWKYIGPFLKKVWDGIKRAFDAVWPPIQRFLLAIWKPILAVFKVIWKAIVIAAKVIWGALKLYFIIWWKVFSTVFKVGIWVIKTIVTLLFRGIVAVIKFIWNAVAAYFRFVFRVWKGIWNLGVAALKLIWEGIKRAWHAVIDPLVRAVKAVWDAVKKAWKLVWDGIKAVVARIWRGLKKEWHFVVDPLVRAVKAVWGAVSKAWKKVWDGIKALVARIWRGLKREWHAVIDPLIRAVKFIWNGIGKVWKTLWEGKSGKGGIKGVLTGVWDKIKKAWHAVIDPLKRVIKFIWNGIGAAWKKSWGFIFRVLEDAWGLIVRLWNDTIGKIPGLGKSEKPSKTGYNPGGSTARHGGGLVPTTGDYTLKKKEGVLSAEAMRGIGSIEFARLNRGMSLAGGGGITISPIINFNSVSPEFDINKARRLLQKMMDDIARQGYHAGKLK